MNTVRCP